jgi:hypothetical protein
MDKSIVKSVRRLSGCDCAAAENSGE